MKIDTRFACGVDITGYPRSDLLAKPKLPAWYRSPRNVLCPLCASGRAPKSRRFWRAVAFGGKPIDNLEYQNLSNSGTRCEACGELAREWRVQQARTVASGCSVNSLGTKQNSY